MKLAAVALALCCLTPSTGRPTLGNVLAPGNNNNNNNAELCASVTARLSRLTTAVGASAAVFRHPLTVITAAVAFGGAYLKLITLPRMVRLSWYSEAELLTGSDWNYTMNELNLSHHHAMLTTADDIRLSTWLVYAADKRRCPPSSFLPAPVSTPGCTMVGSVRRDGTASPGCSSWSISSTAMV